MASMLAAVSPRLTTSSRRTPNRSTSAPAGNCVSPYAPHTTVIATPAAALPTPNSAVIPGRSAGTT